MTLPSTHALVEGEKGALTRPHTSKTTRDRRHEANQASSRFCDLGVVLGLPVRDWPIGVHSAVERHLKVTDPTLRSRDLGSKAEDVGPATDFWHHDTSVGSNIVV